MTGKAQTAETRDMDSDVAREWVAPKLSILSVGATASGANPTTTEGTGGPGGGYFPS